MSIKKTSSALYVLDMPHSLKFAKKNLNFRYSLSGNNVIISPGL